MKMINRLLTAAAVGTVILGAQQFVRGRRRIDFRGRIVLITGGSRGLGLLLARQFAEEGARIVIGARDLEELDRARQELAGYGADVLALQCDVTSRDEVENMVAQVRQRWGSIDVLINNAGVIQVGPEAEMTLDDFEKAMQIHYWGALHTILAVLPDMRRRGAGRIVNISSVGGRIAVPHLLPYCASKFALVGLSEGLRSELLQYGIYVTTVCPGLMRTSSVDMAEFKGQNQEELAAFAATGSYPPMSMNADRAARQIIEACRDGRSDIVLSLPAKLATLIHGIAPGTTADALGMVNCMLPGPGGVGTENVRGARSRPWWLPNWVTALNDRAAERNNTAPTADRIRTQGEESFPAGRAEPETITPSSFPEELS